MDSSLGIPMSRLAEDAAALDEEAFARRHAGTFLVLLHVCVQRGPRVPHPTNRHVEPSTRDTAPIEIESDMLAFPIKKRLDSALPFVGIGRLPGNDVVLPSEKVSKFHAFLKPDARGAFVLLQDGRSSNGTYVDGVPVARRGEGPPTLLRTGTSVRFGDMSMVFLDLPGIMKLVHATKELSRRGSMRAS